MTSVSNYISVVKPGVVLSNLFTTVAGICAALLFVGEGLLENIWSILPCLVGTIAVISGSCLLNNVIDHDIDLVMKRTKIRRTARNDFIDRKSVVIGISMVSFGLSLLLIVSFKSFLAGLVGVLVYVILYTMWSKRKTVHSTIIGSISGAMPPLIGWFCISSEMTYEAYAIFLFMLVWQMPHFYSLAIKHCEDYRKAGVPMLPAVFGIEKARIHILIWILILLLTSLLLIPLGLTFIAITLFLNIGWVIIFLDGLNAVDTRKWASRVFSYSVNSIMIGFGSVIVLSCIKISELSF